MDTKPMVLHIAPAQRFDLCLEDIQTCLALIHHHERVFSRDWRRRESERERFMPKPRTFRLLIRATANVTAWTQASTLPMESISHTSMKLSFSEQREREREGGGEGGERGDAEMKVNSS